MRELWGAQGHADACSSMCISAGHWRLCCEVSEPTASGTRSPASYLSLSQANSLPGRSHSLHSSSLVSRLLLWSSFLKAGNHNTKNNIVLETIYRFLFSFLEYRLCLIWKYHLFGDFSIGHLNGRVRLVVVIFQTSSTDVCFVKNLPLPCSWCWGDKCDHRGNKHDQYLNCNETK